MPEQTHDHPAGQDAPARYVDSQGRVIYRASGFGRCARALVAAARGEEPAPWPDWFQEVLDEGKRLEDQIVQVWEALHDGKYVVEERQRRVELEPMDDVLIVGHLDGLFHEGVDNCLFEAKKFRKAQWQDFITRGVEIHDTYPWQIAIQMHGTGIMRCALVGGLVGDDGNIEEVFTHWLDGPPVPFKAIVKRARELERIIGLGFSPMEVECRADFPCQYHFLHDEKDEQKGEKEAKVFVVPKDRYAAWQGEMASYTAVQNERKRMEAKLKDTKSIEDQHAKLLRKMLKEMGKDAEAATEIHGRMGSKLVLKRVRYTRKEYTVPEAAVDYFKVDDGEKPKRTAKKEDKETAE